MPDPLAQQGRVMAVLGPRGLADGRYYEEPSGMEWLTMEAADVVLAVQEGRDVADLLIDTGYWVPEDEGPFPDDLRAALIAAVTDGLAKVVSPRGD